MKKILSRLFGLKKVKATKPVYTKYRSDLNCDFCLYAVCDVEAEQFGDVFTAKNDKVAMRNFKSLVDSKKIDTSIFTLHRLGFYDSSSGKLYGLADPVYIPYGDVE